MLNVLLKKLIGDVQQAISRIVFVNLHLQAKY